MPRPCVQTKSGSPLRGELLQGLTLGCGWMATGFRGPRSPVRIQGTGETLVELDGALVLVR